MAQEMMPEINQELCVGCGDCVVACPQGALSLAASQQIVLDEDKCAYCGDCEDVCPVGAIALPFEIRLATPHEQTGG